MPISPLDAGCHAGGFDATIIRPNYFQGSHTARKHSAHLQHDPAYFPISDAIARTIRFAIEQPADVDTSEIIVRPTATAL